MISPRIQPRLRGRRAAPLRAAADSPSSPKIPMRPAERDAMIREAAYFRAQRRGFEPGAELEDWLAAEREIDQSLAAPAPPAASTSSGAPR